MTERTKRPMGRRVRLRLNRTYRKMQVFLWPTKKPLYDPIRLARLKRGRVQRAIGSVVLPGEVIGYVSSDREDTPANYWQGPHTSFDYFGPR